MTYDNSICMDMKITKKETSMSDSIKTLRDSFAALETLLLTTMGAKQQNSLTSVKQINGEFLIEFDTHAAISPTHNTDWIDITGKLRKVLQSTGFEPVQCDDVDYDSCKPQNRFMQVPPRPRRAKLSFTIASGDEKRAVAMLAFAFELGSRSRFYQVAPDFLQI